MRWAVLVLLLVAVIALAAAGGHKEGKVHKAKKDAKESRTLEAKRAEFKESHAKENKKCHGKKCGGSEKYVKEKNKKALAEEVDVAETVSRVKREEVPAHDKVKVSKTHKKVPAGYDAKPKKAKKSKSKPVDPAEAEVVAAEEEAAPEATGVAQDGAKEHKKAGKKVKRSADAAQLDQQPVSEKASKGKKKKATEAELGKKKQPKDKKAAKKAAKVEEEEVQAEEPQAETDAKSRVVDAVKGRGPAGVAETCPNDDCNAEE